MKTEETKPEQRVGLSFAEELKLHEKAANVNALGKMIIIRIYGEDGKRKSHYGGMILFNTFREDRKYNYFTLINSSRIKEVKLSLKELENAEIEWKTPLDLRRQDQFFPTDKKGKFTTNKERIERVSKISLNMKKKRSSAGAMATYEPELSGLKEALK